ncbi:MAG: hypothetical protein VX740_11875 [Pseudomonadota bacterium]|nr:hypothetical protein [Pseudomonadota bacterium]MED5424129.1 hypothetical protein [Pseudomonadota bacterium]
MMIKKIFIASLFFVFAAFSILMMRGRLLYLDAVSVGAEFMPEANFFHVLYIALLITYIFFTYLFFKTDPEDDNYRKVMIGMAAPLYAMGVLGILAGIGCAVLGCTYDAVYDPILGTLLKLDFLDRFFGDEAKTLYSFVVQLPLK